jgi:hypothetical protein
MSPKLCPNALSKLSDSELQKSLHDLVRCRRRVTVDILLHLDEVERRGLHLEGACSSLFAYCVQVLSFSEGSAYKHIRASRAARQFPLLLSCVADGSLHLSGISVLSKHLRDENHVELIGAAVNRSKREIERLVAERFGKPEASSGIRKLPERGAQKVPTSSTEANPPGASQRGAGDVDTRTLPLFGELDSGEASSQASKEGLGPRGMEAGPARTAAAGPASPVAGSGSAVPSEVRPKHRSPPRPPEIQPVSGARYSVRFTASAELREKLQTATDLLRHQIPSGDLAQVVDRAVTLLVEKLEARKFGSKRSRASKATLATTPPSETTPSAPERPTTPSRQDQKTTPSAPERPTTPTIQVTTTRPTSTKRRSRYIPAAARREVYERDGGQCTFRSSDGRRCSERGWLEFHHETPFALGGASTAENLTLRCKLHNAFAAEQDFGRPSWPVVAAPS